MNTKNLPSSGIIIPENCQALAIKQNLLFLQELRLAQGVFIGTGEDI
jgi:hypothetical protein